MEIYDGNLKNDTTKSDENEDFVTVVSIGSDKIFVDNTTTIRENDCSGYVTVLKIGEDESAKDVTEEILVYRLPGERLGFGLKFEGGTKAAEYVKRLFIQSCAPDSPASRVRCSWGTLKVGDEVIEIDSIPVKTMTRIDCVRCLKDSNVVIKLLIKHCVNNESEKDTDIKSSTEDVPLVVSAEKKRTPPPPPPVPPRKIPRKLSRDPNNIVIPPKGFDDTNGNSTEIPPLPPARTINGDVVINGIKSQKQSPRNSARSLSKHSPEVYKRDRRSSHSSLGPPDAEVYVDLFSQESQSVCSLSESDDTGSSISTVVDRLSSYPTTTNSSFSGSLPSTPTAIQRHLDLSNINLFDKDDVDDLINNDNNVKNVINGNHTDEDTLINGESCRTLKVGEENGTLRPPVSFQDAPLSYGNEDLRSIETSIRTIENNIHKNEKIILINNNNNNNNSNNSNNNNNVTIEEDKLRNEEIDMEPKRPPPRTKYSSEKNNNSYNVTSLNHSSESSIVKVKDYSLPRLVDFVPKSNKNTTSNQESIELTKLFIENEKKTSFNNIDNIKSESDELTNENQEGKNCVTSVAVPEIWTENDDFYTFNWNPSTHLATIGEDEEEGNQEWNNHTSTPIVIVENVDVDLENEECGIIKKLQNVSDYDVPDGVEENHKNPSTDVETNVDNMDTENLENHISESLNKTDTNGIMEAPSINSRQPPDGHEFPDYQETTLNVNMNDDELNDNNNSGNKDRRNSLSDLHKTIITKAPLPPSVTRSTNISEKISKFSRSNSECTNLTRTYNRSIENCYMPETLIKENLNKPLSKSVMSINNISSATDKSVTYQIGNRINSNTSTNLYSTTPRLHVRSQSLTDIKTDRWSALMEQRRKGLSKLKGLVIPENTEVEDTVDIPEIKSNNTPTLCITELTKPLLNSSVTNYNNRHSFTAPSLTSPPWSSPSLGEYSPAFKRKSLQLCNSNNNKKIDENDKVITQHVDVRPTILTFNDAPKSLESITSPTRSDSSFEYISSSPDLKLKPDINNKVVKATKRRMKEETSKCEDESDNDSAVSSSQSSYISRSSPPASPNHLMKNCNILTNHIDGKDDFDTNPRLLKPKSVEAVNRRNILDSTKCPSGQDVKVGSPQIHRKFKDDKNVTVTETEGNNTSIDVTDNKVEEDKGRFIKPLELPLTAEIKMDRPRLVKASSVSDISKRSQKEITLNNIVLRHTVKTSQKSDDIPLMPKCIRNVKSVSVTDLKKTFENLSPTTPSPPNQIINRISKPDVDQLKRNKRLSLNLPTKSDYIQSPKTTPQRTDNETKPIFVSNEDTKDIIENTLKSFEETIELKDVKVVILKPEIIGGSVGITLAGGVDYEVKDITVHRVRIGSVAYKDGRLQRGDRILSINEKMMKGLTHEESLAILKEPHEEVTIVACKSKDVPTTPINSAASKRHSISFEYSSFSPVTPSTPSPIKELPQTTEETTNKIKSKENRVIEVTLNKDVTGLGFSVEGGFDSPLGNVPLVIKKVFKGGAAEKCGQLNAGDELIEINNVNVTSMSRIDAWTLMKKLPEGAVVIKIRR